MPTPQAPTEAMLLSPFEFELLTEAERQINGNTPGYSWTDILCREDTDHLVQPMWRHTYAMVEAASEDGQVDQAEVARRVAQALLVLGYGS